MIRLESPEQAALWLKSLMHQNGFSSGSLGIDSRKITPGDGFIAWPGAASDGRQHVAAALAAGAVACIVEQNGVEDFGFQDTRIACYTGLKEASGPLAAAFFDHPSRQLRVVAITGTNGKTTTAWWLAAALGRVGLKTAVVGTLGIGVPGTAMMETGLTTPDPVLLQRRLRRLADDGCAAVVMEASSIGIAEHRLDGLCIEAAVFTNFTQDHLDYHGSMEAYWQAKAALFEWPGLKSAVVNTDDAKGQELAARLKHQEVHLWTVCVASASAGDSSAGLRAVNMVHTAQGLRFSVQCADTNEMFSVASGMVGVYNISNLLGVLATLCAMGVSLPVAVKACHDLPAVPGRCEQLHAPGKPMVVIDYAHTPDALEKVLAALRPLAQQRQGDIICLFGCGGDRDTAKRSLMGAAAEKGADRVLLTSDNPRSESPLTIINQIFQGFVKPGAVFIEPDRRLAIAQAIHGAKVPDIVLIAGKGHETTQEINNLKIRFSDAEEALKSINSWVDESIGIDQSQAPDGLEHHFP